MKGHTSVGVEVGLPILILVACGASPFSLQTSGLERPFGGSTSPAPSFTDGETEAERGEGACAESHSKWEGLEGKRKDLECPLHPPQPLSLEL